MNRRAWIKRWLKWCGYSAPLATVLEAAVVEPGWIRVERLHLENRHSGHRARCVQFSDIHHKGDIAYLNRVVGKINAIKPDFVCFTGDLIEDSAFLEEALGCVTKIEAPLYGIPGNHDHWSGVDFSLMARAFSQQGGAWLVNQTLELPQWRIRLMGIDALPIRAKPEAGWFNLLLAHYPAWADGLLDEKFDLILAGHTHGGQVRLPWVGALLTPFLTGAYERGLFQSRGGPLYVNPGIGYFYLNLRFNCRPELTVFEIGT